MYTCKYIYNLFLGKLVSINDEHITSNTLPADSKIGQFNYIHLVPVNLNEYLVIATGEYFCIKDG